MFDLKKASSIESSSKAEAKTDYILIVDDEEINRLALSEMLQRDYNVETAKTGREALEKIREQEFGVVVADHRMPGMTGVELFIELERQNTLSSKIVLTGFADLNSVVSAVNDGKIYNYLKKPIKGDDFRLAVRQAMSHFKMKISNRCLVSMVKRMMEEHAKLSKRLSQHEPIQSPELTETMAYYQPQKMNLSILFADIRGFTAFSSNTEAERVISVLQDVFQFMHPLVYDCGGFVDKHLGDGLMAVFGLGDNSNPAAAAICMQRMVDSAEPVLSELSQSVGGELRLGIGCASGEIVLGMVGSDLHNELAIIGQPANRANRLQEMTKLPLVLPRAEEVLGSFHYAMGIADPSLVEGLEDFRIVDLPDSLRVRDFHELTQIGVIAC